MDSAVEISFSDLCRICANPSISTKRIPLYGSDSEALKLLDKMQKHLSIMAEENDGYPDFACYNCTSKLCIFANLHQTYLDASERLKALKNQLDLESKSNIYKSYDSNTSSIRDEDEAKNALSIDFQSDIDQEMKGSYEMLPNSDSSRVAVILPKESENPRSLLKRSLVLVNIPIDKDSVTLGCSEKSLMISTEEESSISKEIKQQVTREIEEAYRNLPPRHQIPDSGLRRSARPKVHNRFYDEDIKSEQEQHVCQVCDITFANYKKFHCHQRSQSHVSKFEAKNLVCSKCKVACNSAEHLETHDCKPHGCEFCNVIFDNEQEKKLHQQLHKGSYTCDMCNATFLKLSILQNHIMCHTAVSSRKKLFQCKICGKLFKSRIGLQGHESNHMENRFYSCYVCQETYKSKDDLLLHRSHHTKEEKDVQLGRLKKSKPYPCEICRKNLSSKAGLEVHLRMHRDEKPFECSECGKHFRQEIKLRYHLRLHFGDLPYGCDSCDKRFNTQRQLDTHTRVHTNERPYICEVCGLGFRSNGVLGRHKQTHSEEPLFACSLCGKKFRTRHATTMHERSHTGEKRMICDVCGRSFAHKTTLDKHRLRHEKQRVSCVECDVSFSTKRGLKRHFEKKHSVTVVQPVQIYESMRTTEYVTLTGSNEELLLEIVV